MKKSEIYHLCQIAIINSAAISPEGKIEAMKLLIEDEAIALFGEKRDAEAAAKAAAEA